jgi:type IV secretion system protein VirB5
MGSLRKSTVYKPLPVKNPFEAQDRVYHDLLKSAGDDKRRWQTIAFVAMTFVVGCIGILVYAVGMRKTVPVLVAVAQWGEAQYLGEVKGASSLQVPEAAIQYQVRDFISSLRGVPGDSDILYRDITRCYDMITAKAEKKMTAELRAHDPFKEVGKLKRAVSIETILRLSTETYQADWIEKSSGADSKTVRFRGLFTVKLLEPPEKKRAVNPLGIYIDDYDMTELETRGGN